MHHYPFHVGDYAKDCAHLDLVEDAVYRRSLDLYYLSEAPLPAEPAVVARLIRARDHVEVVAAILEEFFTLTADGWRHERCDAELASYHERAERARENGRAGGRPPKQDAKQKPSGFSVGSDVGTQQEPKSKTNQEPRTINQEEEKEKNSASGGDESDASLLWTIGVDYLTGKGATDKTARGLLGKAKKVIGEDATLSLIRFMGEKAENPTTMLADFIHRAQSDAVLKAAWRAGDWSCRKLPDGRYRTGNGKFLTREGKLEVAL